MKDPPVLVVTRRTTRKNKYIDYVGEYHLELLIRLRMFPVMVPVVEGTLALSSAVHARHERSSARRGRRHRAARFKSRRANFQYLEKTHPLKDEHRDSPDSPRLAPAPSDSGHLPRIAAHQCRLRGNALTATCRRKSNSALKHINYGEDYDTYRHPVTIVPETPLASGIARRASA